MEAGSLDGTPFKLYALHGKYVHLDFWATWCGFCRAEMPSVKVVYNTFKNDSRLVMVSLSLDKDMKEPVKYAQENGMAWTQVFLGDWAKTSIPENYGVRDIPAVMLVDPEGKLAAKDLRGEAILSKVRETLK